MEPTNVLTRRRSAGVLLPVFSLPGDYGIGDLGPEAYRWIDRLAAAKLSWWQILPLGPAGVGESPYQCASAFAGNPLLISPELLYREGWLEKRQLRRVDGRADRINYARVRAAKRVMLAEAWQHFRLSSRRREEFERFVQREGAWLGDYALFAALHRGRGAWPTWDARLRRREPAALGQARRELREEVQQEQFFQFLFARQLGALREHARRRGVGLLGDLPIFVSLNSPDVWANQRLFELGRDGRPTAISGVPPDLFSATGQRWDNPLYRWPVHARSGYAWWAARLRQAFLQADAVRLDHFRGFAGYWRIPAQARTAASGSWRRGPGLPLFRALEQKLGKLPLLAEDLGMITPDVTALRQCLGLPGMLVLQFAFDGDMDNPYLPHNHTPNMVAYTGTHDNDTCMGWFRAQPAKVRRRVMDYLPRAEKDAAWAMVESAWSSVARCAIAPLQDMLSLSGATRLNLPGTTRGNWRWRYVPRRPDQERLQRLRELTLRYGRGTEEVRRD